MIGCFLGTILFVLFVVFVSTSMWVEAVIVVVLLLLLSALGHLMDIFG